ncbi:MAG: pseudouridine synthase [Bryobacterales bacterium]
MSLGAKADVATDVVKVRGKIVSGPAPEKIDLMLNKPKGYVVTTDDPEGRRTVMDLLGKMAAKVYPVGRLDFWSEGLLLFTNDGDFANHVLAAKTEIPKTYEVKSNAALTRDQLDKFRRGVVIDGRRTAPAKIRILKAGPNPWYEVQLIEGRNRQIRKMFLALGILVEKIRRVSVGPLRLGKLAAGQVRDLTEREVERMQALWDPKMLKKKAAAAEERPLRTDRPQRSERPQSSERPRPADRTRPTERPRPAGRKAAKKTASRPEGRPSGRPTGRPEGRPAGKFAKKASRKVAKKAARPAPPRRGRPR